MPDLHVHCVHAFGDDFEERLATCLTPDVKMTWGEELPTASTFDILVNGRPTREQLESHQHLKALIIPWAGLPIATRDLLRQFPDLPVHNLHHNAVPTAEMAFTLIMAAAKDLIPIDRGFRAHDWTPRYTRSRSMTLSGRAALILGFGAIGQQVARMCRGANMTVHAIRRRSATSAVDGVTVHPPTALHDLLPRADAVIICLPWTEETTALIGDAELAMLPDQAILVNVARGGIVNEDALYAALSSGRIRAGLDVWYSYPRTEEDRSHTPPSSHDFATLPNVVMTPHLAGHPMETEVRRAEALAELLNAAAAGKPMPNRVDTNAGY